MYRDGSTLLDERDRAVGAMQIGEGLIAECAAAAKRMHGTDRPERWRAARVLHDGYPEIWRQLDGARRVLANRGANTIGYDELRSRIRTVLPIGDDRNGTPVTDNTALDDARRALEELRLAVPGADWSGIEKRTQGLLGAVLLKRGQRVGIAGVLVAFLLVATAWTAAAIPEKKENPRLVMRRELATVVAHRRAEIGQLEAIVGERCDQRFRVHELMKLLVLDGQWQQARAFAESYQLRCGPDVVVEKWAKAPRPPSAR